MRFLLILLTFAAVIVPGLAHGVWTCRWTWSDEPFASAEKLNNVPLFFGEWDAEEIDMPPEQLARSETVGFLARVYTNRLTRKQVQVFVACGRPGPVSLHTPDICFVGAGFRMKTAQTKTEIDGNELYTATFHKPSPTKPVTIQVYWAWSTGGAWHVPSYPRWTFARFPVLHKLYVVTPTTLEDPATEQEISKRFIQEFIPHLRECLFTAKS